MMRPHVARKQGGAWACALLFMFTLFLSPALYAEQTVDNKAEPAEAKQPGLGEKLQSDIDESFGVVNKYLKMVLFFDVSFGVMRHEVVDEDGRPVLGDDGEPKIEGPEVPLLVLFLLLGGIYFTLRFGFINVRLFGHSIAVIRGKYDNPDDHGEISHFQALTSALSATVGLGNIAGVAIAISQGGPGAVFWMWVVAFFGMSSKFASCTLAQLYRRIGPEGEDHLAADEKHKARKDKSEHVLGGPMVYLHEGMKETFGGAFGNGFGKVLAVSFAFFAICGSLGGGNMFQSNQTSEIVSFVILEGDKSYAWLIGAIMAVMVGLVIVGGIKRIGDVTSKVVPAMCVFYCVVCLIILITNIEDVPTLFASIFDRAFNIKAIGWGGAVGVLVTGVTRGAFSNEAGLGSAAIAHSAAKTKEPVREGVVAMIGPFIDTLVVCTMTALTILITQGQFDEAALGDTKDWVRGAAMTAEAFGTLHGFLPFLLCIAVFVFAYSTMIAWSYYGERSVEYLFGRKGIWPYRAVFLLFVLVGPVVSIGNVLNFTDFLILSMAYPNILGVVILSPKLTKLARDYVGRLKSGEIKPYEPPPESSDPAADI